MRFRARCADGLNNFGVWDETDEKWRTSITLPQAQAVVIAADLNAQYDENGPRPPETVRRLSPSRRAEARVIAQRWRTGDLDLWIREADGWHGHLRFDDDNNGAWFPADRLRPSTD